MNDAWLDQLESDLKNVEEIKRSADSARAMRIALINAKGPDFLEQLARQAKKASDRLRLDFAAHEDRSFSITRRTPYARLDVTPNLAGHSIKARYTQSLGVGAGEPTEDEEVFSIRIDENDDLYLTLQSNGKTLCLSAVLDRMLRAALLPR